MKLLKYAPYSYSRINTWLQCPRKFRYSYVEKIVKWETSAPLDRGKLVHSILEHSDSPKISKEVFDKVKKTQDWRDIQEHDILTLDDYKKCIKMSTDFKASKMGVFLDSCEPVAKEMSIGMDKTLEIVSYTSPDAIFRGYIDLVVRKGDNLIICDYKTGKYKPDMSWDQLLYYAIAMFSVTPPEVEEITIMNLFVEHLKVNKTTLNRKDINKYKKALFTNIANIEKDTKFEKNETTLCNWCQYQPLCDHKSGDPTIPWE